MTSSPNVINSFNIFFWFGEQSVTGTRHLFFYFCQVSIGETAYGEGQLRLAQQSQQWLGNQWRWSVRDTDGNTEVINCHWPLLGSGTLEGLFSESLMAYWSPPWSSAGTLCFLRVCRAGFWPDGIHLYLSSCEPPPWCFTGSRTPSWAMAWHACS